MNMTDLLIVNEKFQHGARGYIGYFNSNTKASKSLVYLLQFYLCFFILNRMIGPNKALLPRAWFKHTQFFLKLYFRTLKMHNIKIQ